MKKFFTFILVAVMILGVLPVSAETEVSGRPNSEIAVMLNGEWMQFDVDPIMINDRTLVPFRVIFEALGCLVSWDDESQTAMGERNGMKIELPIGSEKVTVKGETVSLDQPAVLTNDRTLVPLRFVSEALGAEVNWTEETQTVTIRATIPLEAVLFTKESYIDAGTWTMEVQAEGAFEGEAMRGTVPDVKDATIADADTTNNQPAVAPFTIKEGGTYKIWVRSKDFAANQQGTRYFQLAFNDQPLLEYKYGSHGGTGYAWACGGTIELNAGENTLYVHDTSGFYARFDAVLLTKDMDYVPADNYQELTQKAAPRDNSIRSVGAFPAYANEQGMPTESTTIENEHTKVMFYKVPTSKGQVIQNEIFAKHNGQWVKTNSREEDLGYIVMKADEAASTVSDDVYNMIVKYTANGRSGGGMTKNPYKAGVGTYFVPTDYTVNGNSVVLSAENSLGALQAVWSLDNETYPLVSIDFTPAQSGFYCVGAWEGKAFEEEEYEYALAPFRVQYKRVSEDPALLNEQYLFTPMGTHTLYKDNQYSSEPVTKGVVFEPSWIPQRWVYADNCLLGISMHSPTNGGRGTAFAPIMGSPESNMQAGTTYNMQVRMVSDVADWFENYSNTVTNLFDVNDYRKNYGNSLNDAIFNTRKLMLDDKYSGWDSLDKAHYNMEGKNVTSDANSMEALQVYLLTEDEEVLEKRAIPTIANALTRGSIHFNRTGVVGGASYWAPKTKPDPIGKPVSGFNANVVGGMYEMTRGFVPYLHEYSVEKGQETVVNSYGSIAPFSNDLTLYKYTGDQTYLDKAIAAADEYLKTQVYAEDREQPAWDSFIYISYYPNLSSLLDIYEVTKDQKYLEAAEYVAQWMTTGLWIPGIDGEKKTDGVVANDLSEVQKRFIHNSETATAMWWAGDQQMRIGREDLQDTDHNNEIISSKTREVEGWIPSRVGLGIEQASTFTRSANIIMNSFAGDFMKLSAYTGNDFYATSARNAIIGRFRSYDGYYRNTFITYPQESDYPYDGPDYNSVYWHHIPPYLAMLEDFLINQTFAWSGKQISFPSVRQQGYAYFNSNQYGFEAGKFYDESEMWAWLDEGIVQPDSIQIDWMAARKDGVVGIAFMNEDETDTTTTVKLGEKIPGGESYSGTATLYDKTGKIGTVEVVSGTFALTVPGKSLQAVKIKINTVKAPGYSKAEYSCTEAEIGATVSNHRKGKGYALQMSGENYFAYVYTTYQASAIQSATITYDIGGGAKKTETATQYPFEFIIKVDDVDQEFHYTMSVTKKNGDIEQLGGGTLMTAAKSAAKGIRYDASLEADADKIEASEEAKTLKFKPTVLDLDSQGTDGENFRLIVKQSALPFQPTADNVQGLVVTGTLVDGSKEVPFNAQIIDYEARDGDKCVLVVTSGGLDVQKYASTATGTFKHQWKDLTVNPVGSSDQTGTGPANNKSPAEIQASDDAKALQFNPAVLSLDTQGIDGKNFRFVVHQSSIPFMPSANNVKGLVITATLVDGDKEIPFHAQIVDYEARDGDKCVLVVTSGNLDVQRYASTATGTFHHQWKDLTIHPVEHVTN